MKFHSVLRKCRIFINEAWNDGEFSRNVILQKYEIIYGEGIKTVQDSFSCDEDCLEDEINNRGGIEASTIEHRQNNIYVNVALMENWQFLIIIIIL